MLQLLGFGIGSINKSISKNQFLSQANYKDRIHVHGNDVFQLLYAEFGNEDIDVSITINTWTSQTKLFSLT